MITREQWKGINFRKIEEYAKEIEEYDGSIPLRLYDYINIGNRITYLTQQKQEYEYANIQEYRRTHDVERDINEIIDFVNKNPKFLEIIKIDG